MLGGEPLLVVSGGGWRCTEYAAAVHEGLPGPDYHTQGLAVDITLKDLSPAQVQRHLVPHLGKLLAGIASHRGFSHLQRSPAQYLRWRPNVLTPKG